MQESEEEWTLPPDQRADRASLEFDLKSRTDAVFALRSEIAEDGYTTHALGTERAGAAILIDASGMFLTIGYLIAEAERVWLVDAMGGAVEGHVMAYDFVTGFGLVQAMGPVNAEPLTLGSSADMRVGDTVVFAGAGGPERALKAQLVSRREFAGYWEYLLEEALFTVPAHPSWGGAAVLNARGELVAVGSLFVGDARGHGTASEGNMAVPVDLVKPLLDEIRSGGRMMLRANPWLGMYMAEVENYLVVAGLAPGGPAEKAGIETGDVVLEVANSPIGDLADLLRTIWSLGDPGVVVPLTVVRDGKALSVAVTSASRGDFLKAPRLH